MPRGVTVASLLRPASRPRTQPLSVPYLSCAAFPRRTHSSHLPSGPRVSSTKAPTWTPAPPALGHTAGPWAAPARAACVLGQAGASRRSTERTGEPAPRPPARALDRGSRPLSTGPLAGGACGFGQQDGPLAAQPQPEATGLVPAAAALLGRHSDSHPGPVISLCVCTQVHTRVRPCGFSPVLAHASHPSHAHVASPSRTPARCPRLHLAVGHAGGIPASGSSVWVPVRVTRGCVQTWASVCVECTAGQPWGQLGPRKDQGSVLSRRRPTALGKQNTITMMMFEKHFFHFPWESGSFRNRGVRWLS